MKEEEKSLFEIIYPDFEKIDIYLEDNALKNIKKFRKKEKLKGLLNGMVIYNKKTKESIITVHSVRDCSKYSDEDFVAYAIKLNNNSKNDSKSYFEIFEGPLGFFVSVEECNEEEIRQYNELHELFLEKIHTYAICMVIDKNLNYAFVKPDGTILFEK
jgi:hypothetical protein